jgi:hypothetical protein
MRLGRILALLFALLPSAASGTIWRVDFVVDDLLLETFGNGSSFITLPADGIVRGAYFYDDTPTSGSMVLSNWDLSWADGETGAFVRIGPSLFALITSANVSDSDFMSVHWTNDWFLLDEQQPENSIYYDHYDTFAQENEPEGPTTLSLHWQEDVLASDVEHGAPFPSLLTGVSFTDIPDPTVLPFLFSDFQFRIEHGSDIAMLTGDVTGLSLHVSPMPEPGEMVSVGAGSVLLAALAGRRRSARLAAG